MRHSAKTVFTNWRALLVIVALLSLCVSDGVGPRLLPFPDSAEIDLAAGGSQPAQSQLSRAPAPDNGSTPRVQMAVTVQYRAGTRHIQELHSSHAAHGVIELTPEAVACTSYHPVEVQTSLVSVPEGRGPPQLT